MRPTERGQITIPKPIREKYGITPSTELEIIEKDEGLLFVKARAESPLRKFRGIAKSSRGIPATTDEFIKAIREG